LCLTTDNRQELDTHHKALTLNLDLSTFGSFAEIDQLRLINALLAGGGDVLLFRERQLYAMTALVNRYTKGPSRFVVGLSLMIRAFVDPYGNHEGRRFEGLARLFAQNVRVYADATAATDLQAALAK